MPTGAIECQAPGKEVLCQKGARWLSDSLMACAATENQVPTQKVIRYTELAALVWLTRQQAADYTQVSVRTVARWLSEGLPHVGGNGKKVLIRADELVEWLKQNR